MQTLDTVGKCGLLKLGKKNTDLKFVTDHNTLEWKSEVSIISYVLEPLSRFNEDRQNIQSSSELDIWKLGKI